MRHSASILLIFFLCVLNSHAQQPVFSQFYTSSLYLNPALGGLEKDILISTNYRSQWSAIGVPFKTFQVSALHPIMQYGARPKQLGGLGATLYSDVTGPNQEIVNQGFSIASSYNFHLTREGNNVITTALQFGVMQRSINLDGLRWSSQYSSAVGYDPTLPGETLSSDRVTTPVLNAGAMWRFNSVDRLKPFHSHYHGIAISNINRPRGFFVDRKEAPATVYKFHGGYLRSLGHSFEISPNYLIIHQRVTEINVGFYGTYRLDAITSQRIRELKISLGCWYRLNDSMTTTAGVITERWNFGLSYDSNAQSMDRVFPGANSYELSFSYRISVGKQITKFASPLM